jgi:hypothetical protein
VHVQALGAASGSAGCTVAASLLLSILTEHSVSQVPLFRRLLVGALSYDSPAHGAATAAAVLQHCAGWLSSADGIASVLLNTLGSGSGSHRGRKRALSSDSSSDRAVLSESEDSDSSGAESDAPSSTATAVRRVIRPTATGSSTAVLIASPAVCCAAMAAAVQRLQAAPVTAASWTAAALAATCLLKPPPAVVTPSPTAAPTAATVTVAPVTRLSAPLQNKVAALLERLLTQARTAATDVAAALPGLAKAPAFQWDAPHSTSSSSSNSVSKSSSGISEHLADRLALITAVTGPHGSALCAAARQWASGSTAATKQRGRAAAAGALSRRFATVVYRSDRCDAALAQAAARAAALLRRWSAAAAAAAAAAADESSSDDEDFGVERTRSRKKNGAVSQQPTWPPTSLRTAVEGLTACGEAIAAAAAAAAAANAAQHKSTASASKQQKKRPRSSGTTAATASARTSAAGTGGAGGASDDDDESSSSESSNVRVLLAPKRRGKKRRLRSRNAVIDSWLEDEDDADGYVDLEDFLAPNELSSDED